MNNIFVPAGEFEKQKQIAASLRSVTKNKTACVITFGCQQNESDSEKLRGLLELCGYTLTEDSRTADTVIINTCAIREHAELRALSEAGQFKGAKEKNPKMLIALCGCMAQQKGRRDQLKKSYPYVDFVFGTDRIHYLPQMIKEAMSSKKRLSFITDLPHTEFGTICEGVPAKRESSYAAWVPVMYGCNNFCTYCVVPHVRGRERSRSKDHVLAEVKELVSNGYKDITLLGQNVNSYDGGCDFAELLTECASFGGEYRVRFMTSHPKDAKSSLIRAIADNQNVAKHFHLPVQSGSTEILKRMNRRYTREQYLEKAFEIKQTIPGVALTTDIIVGFPGETEEDFLQTMSLVEQVGFDMIYTFIYSRRPDTPAEKMDCQIPREVSNRRFAALSELQNEMAQRINDGLVGQTLRVLSDGLNKNGIPCGRSSGNKIVTFDTLVPMGDFCDVRITKAGNYALSGELVK